jgi:hypothetical protein
MKFAKLFISVIGLALLAFVVIGFLLPGDWSTVRTRTVDASPDSVFAQVSDLRRWTVWSTLSEVEGVFSDPSSGAGAVVSWEDEIWGDGELRLTSVIPGREVSYEVGVEGGSILTRGRITISGSGGGASVRWEESGDMGWNPFIAYFALGMERMQGQELEKQLDRLEALVEGRELPTFDPA